ncbi:L-2-hydroxyglutarate dehydrogenase, mitochondrial-like [Lycorma delicatula]|uniref:L-2-hydroxyglutarate dehydrogenase, mitochondrial-like n=1 Tax=Lycorma delicatula TaxID=130591 RepID=UPI003F5139FC
MYRTVLRFFEYCGEVSFHNSCSFNTAQRFGSSFNNFKNIVHVPSQSSLARERFFDVVVVGGGIVGMSTALRLKKRFPNFNVAVCEKELYLAAHQSGNNGGVIHAGICYKPGSLRSKLCIEGMQRLYKYCEAYNIPHKRNGKLIVATNPQEEIWLNNLYDNAIKNNVLDIKMLNSNEIKQIEPHCKGLKALYSPNTGIVNYGAVTRHLGQMFRDLGGNILLGFNVIRSRFVVTCGGLRADELAEMTGESRAPQIIPIRGEYFFLTDAKKHLVNGSIYQVPNPVLPFHGIHLTSQLDGKVWVGPRSMLASQKEGYNWSDYNIKDLWDMFTYPGLQLFVYKYFGACFHEFMKSANINVTLNKLQRYFPSLKLRDLVP